MANADRCICCGEIVPEGRQICPHKAEDDSFSNVELQINSVGGLLVGADERDEARKDWNVRADDIDLIKQKGTFYENQKNYKSVQGE